MKRSASADLSDIGATEAKSQRSEVCRKRPWLRIWSARRRREPARQKLKPPGFRP